MRVGPASSLNGRATPWNVVQVTPSGAFVNGSVTSSAVGDADGRGAPDVLALGAEAGGAACCGAPSGESFPPDPKTPTTTPMTTTTTSSTTAAITTARLFAPSGRSLSEASTRERAASMGMLLPEGG